MRKFLVISCLLLVSFVSGVSRGDSWAAPGAHLFASEDGTSAMKIVPNGTGLKATATATWIKVNRNGALTELSSLPLVNVPLRVLLPGRPLHWFVTLDTHGGAGYKHALVIYRYGGGVVRDLKLEDFLTAEEIRSHVGRSVSSRWWREGTSFRYDVPTTDIAQEKDGKKYFTRKQEPDNARLLITFPWGRQVAIKLATGEVLPSAPAA